TAPSSQADDQPGSRSSSSADLLGAKGAEPGLALLGGHRRHGGGVRLGRDFPQLMQGASFGILKGPHIVFAAIVVRLPPMLPDR
ncbi:MAG: hypothetical protein ACJ72W_03670, partial [Actinoallomurus sp.]